jgi:hypothetical protein
MCSHITAINALIMQMMIACANIGTGKIQPERLK